MTRRSSPEYLDNEIADLIGAELESVWAEIPPRPESCAAANKAAFIAAGVRLAGEHRPMRVLSLRVFRYAAIFAFMLVSTFAGARALSAQSLPGDTLYPVKLSLENADRLFYESDSWQSQQEARRLAEVLAVAAYGEDASVSFVATPTRTEDGRWIVGNVPLMVTAEQSLMLGNQCVRNDNTVRIFGQVRDGAVYVTALTPSCFYLASR